MFFFDLTVCILSDTEFYCVLPAADPYRFQRHLRICQKKLNKENVTWENVTEDFATLAIMGPKSRRILEKLYPKINFNNDTFQG